MVGFMCYINGRIDPTQFFYNLMVVFDSQPDLHSLKRSIEQHVAEDGVCTDGGDFIVSEIEILDFRTNMWVNLESRAQLYSGCHLTAIRSLMGASCSGTIDRSRKTSLQRVLGFALDAQRIFEVLDIDDEGKIRLKGLLRVLRQDVDYAVDVFSFLDKSSEGQVSFQVFLQSFNDFSNRPFFDELQRRIAVGGKRIDAAASSSEGGSAGERSSHHRSGDASPTSSSAGIAIPPRASLPVIVTDAGNQESTAAQVLTDEEKAKALRVVEMFKSSAKKVSSSTGGEGGGDPKVSQGVMNRLKNLARSKAAASAGNSTSPGGSQLPSSSPHVAAASSSPFGPIASSTASTASSGSKKASGAVK